MARSNLEERLKTLESRVDQLTDELRAAQRAFPRDWRRTIGAFTDDEGMQEILRDAMCLREADRKKVRSRMSKSRRSSS